MAGIFISYAREDDEPFVLGLYERLRKEGLDVWWDRAAMESRGRTFLQEILDAIADAERLVLVVGPKATSSDYVRFELRFALEACKVVVPILRLGDLSNVPPEVPNVHCPDFREGRPLDEALAELTRILTAAVPPLAELHGVDALPAHFLPRPDAIAALSATVLEDTVAPTVITSAKQTAALQGMGGIGKSVLAAAFARECTTRRACGDGIVWLRVGPRPALAALGITLARALNAPEAAAKIESIGELTQLSAVLADKRCLIVLDDVWNVGHVAPFRNALGTRARLLVTSRDAGLIAAVGAREHRLDVLPDAQALTMLAEWSAQALPLPADAHAVMRECGGLPLALAMAGAMAREKPYRWPHIRERLEKADLDRIRAEFPSYPYPDLLKTIEVGVEALDGSLPERYLDFAVFPAGLAVPVAVVRRLWEAAGMDALDTEDAIALLVDRSLAQRDERGRMRLHDLQTDFVLRRAPSRKTLHARLLASYERECPDGWASGPDDGYFLDQLAYHLVEAGRREDLVALATTFDWIQRRLTAGGVASLFRDFHESGDAPGPIRVRAALRRAAQALQSNPAELAGQLLARIDRDADPGLAPLLERAVAAMKPPWLRPVRASLAANRSRLTLSGHEGTPRAVAITPSGRWAISAAYSGDADRSVRVWDLDAGDQVACFERETDASGLPRVALTPDGRFALCSVACDVKVWVVARAQPVATLRGHDAVVTAVAVDADGTRIVSGDEAGRVIVWDAHTWTESGRPIEGAGPVCALATSVQGSRAAAAFDGAIEIWDLQTSASVASVTLDQAFPERWQEAALTFSADARRMYFGNPLYEWTVDSAIPPVLLADVPSIGIVLGVSADGSTVAGTNDGTTIEILDRSTGQTRTIPAQPMAIRTAALTPDGRRLAVSYRDHQLVIWELDRQAQLSAVRLRDQPRTMRLSPNGETVQVWYQDGAREVWRLEDGTPLGPADETSPPGPSPQEPPIVAEVRNLVRRETASQRLFGKKADRYRSRSVQGHHGDRVLVVEQKTHTQREEAERADEPEAARDFAVHIVWREQGRRALSSRKLGAHASLVTSARFTPDGTRVVSASLGRLIRVWDVASAKELFTLSGHRGIIRQVVVTPDSRYAVSVSDDRTVRAWDLQTVAEVARFSADAAMMACAVTPDGRMVAGLDTSGIVHALVFER